MISCEDYDYIEIACLYHFPITLTLHSGEKISAIASDTQRNAQQRECIKLLIEPSQQTNFILVELQSIARLEVNKANPHFLCIDFTN